MRCKSCHADLHIDDEVCRYCGTVNPRFKKHRKNMKVYQTDYNYTKKEVIKESKKLSSKYLRIITIFSLIIINITLFFIFLNMWNIQNWLEETEINKNLSFHKTNLDNFLAEEDFIGLYNYLEEYDLRYISSLDEYRAVINANNYYHYIYKYLIDYKTSSYEHMTTSELSMKISDYFDTFYESTTQMRYEDPARFSDEFVASMQAMSAELELLVVAYANVDAQVAAQFPTLSTAERAIILEEGLENEK